jgi:phosphoserine phosphatase
MYTRDMAARLKRAGYQLIAISGSPQEILDLFLTPLGFDRSWGTVLAQDARGCYTGEVLHYPFKNKRQVLEGFLMTWRWVWGAPWAWETPSPTWGFWSWFGPL